MNVQNWHVAGYSYVQFLLKSQNSISEYRLWSRTTYGTCINRSVIDLGKYTSYALGKHNNTIIENVCQFTCWPYYVAWQYTCNVRDRYVFTRTRYISYTIDTV